MLKQFAEAILKWLDEKQGNPTAEMLGDLLRPIVKDLNKVEKQQQRANEIEKKLDTEIDRRLTHGKEWREATTKKNIEEEVPKPKKPKSEKKKNLAPVHTEEKPIIKIEEVIVSQTPEISLPPKPEPTIASTPVPLQEKSTKEIQEPKPKPAPKLSRDRRDISLGNTRQFAQQIVINVLPIKEALTALENVADARVEYKRAEEEVNAPNVTSSPEQIWLLFDGTAAQAFGHQQNFDKRRKELEVAIGDTSNLKELQNALTRMDSFLTDFFQKCIEVMQNDVVQTAAMADDFYALDDIKPLVKLRDACQAGLTQIPSRRI